MLLLFFHSDRWISATQQNESWTAENVVRVFDPYVFDNAPKFDTGNGEGVWTPRVKQAETWTAE